MNEDEELKVTLGQRPGVPGIGWAAQLGEAEREICRLAELLEASEAAIARLRAEAATAEERALLDLAAYARAAARQVGEGAAFLDGAASAFLDIAQEAERRATAVASGS